MRRLRGRRICYHGVSNENQDVCHHRRRWCDKEADLPRELSTAFAVGAECECDLKTTWPVVMSVVRRETVKPDAEPTYCSRGSKTPFLVPGQWSATRRSDIEGW